MLPLKYRIHVPEKSQDPQCHICLNTSDYSPWIAHDAEGARHPFHLDCLKKGQHFGWAKTCPTCKKVTETSAVIPKIFYLSKEDIDYAFFTACHFMVTKTACQALLAPIIANSDSMLAAKSLYIGVIANSVFKHWGRTRTLSNAITVGGTIGLASLHNACESSKLPFGKQVIVSTLSIFSALLAKKMNSYKKVTPAIALGCYVFTLLSTYHQLPIVYELFMNIAGGITGEIAGEGAAVMYDRLKRRVIRH